MGQRALLEGLRRMNNCSILQEAKTRFAAELKAQAREGNDCGELNDEVVVSSPLGCKEAIGNPAGMIFHYRGARRFSCRPFTGVGRPGVHLCFGEFSGPPKRCSIDAS